VNKMATKRRRPRRREKLPVYPGPAHPEHLPNRTTPGHTPQPGEDWPEIPDFANDDIPWPPTDPAELAAHTAWLDRALERQLAADDYARLELQMLIGRYEAEPQYYAIVRERLAEYRSLLATLDEPEMDPAF
jgi:hypothetical protein